MDDLELVQREGGGWLASGQATPSIRIAVEGNDENEVRAAFAEASDRWQKLVAVAEHRQEA